MTLNEFKGAMAMLGASFNRELTRPLMTIYWTEFQAERPDDFRDAVTELIRTVKFFPTVAELRTALGSNGGAGSLAEAGSVFEALTNGPAPHYDPRRGDWWGHPDVMERFGAQAYSSFLAVGGTATLRDRTERNLDYIRRDFMAAWEEYNRQPGVRRAITDRVARGSLGVPLQPGLAPITDTVRRLMPGGPESP